MRKYYVTLFLAVIMSLTTFAQKGGVYRLSDYGIKPNSSTDCSPLMVDAIAKIKATAKPGAKITLLLEKGRYEFYPQNSTQREYYISNHDQDNPKNVGIALENLKDITLDGAGADLIFHGRMLPIAMVATERCTIKNLSIDFPKPHIAQIEVVENNPEKGYITYRVAPWVDYTIRDSAFYHSGLGWEMHPQIGIAFEQKSRRLVYNTSDINVGTRRVEEIAPRTIKANGWVDPKLIPGTVIVMRTYYRPAPAILLTQGVDTRFENVKIHYAEGMGLLAQMSENITLDRFGVCLRGESDPRYFTTQADATHFSACKGKISSCSGLYEGMMDDAINIHGTYLKISKRLDERTVTADYMHYQAWGFEWGRPGDKVQFVESSHMELIGAENSIASISAIDKPTEHGAKQFRITFREPLAETISEASSIGIENLTWTPEVLFANNMIRNNRARGTLFSTPRKTVVEGNTFDHTSGTAILLCGDCNGWFETGACRDIVIRKNKFINSLTNMFQFTNAVISIYPEIPNLKDQKKYFHSGIVIEDNVFETFDIPLLYAKSVDGIVFRRNKIIRNSSYPAFHWNKAPLLFERVVNADINNNFYEDGSPVEAATVTM